MRWTRLSFFYLIGYLMGGGVALLVAPEFSLRLLGASHSYGPLFPRFVGSFMVAFALVVVQIVRRRVEILYPTPLIARAVLLGTIVWLYAESRDPLFLALTAVVGFGMILTSFGLWADRTAASK
jgi:hypothetical protein